MKIIQLKLLGLIVMCVFTMKNSHGQTSKIDSLRYLLESSLIDTNKVDLQFQIGIEFKNSNPDLFLESMQDALMLSNKIGYAKGEFECRVAMLNYWWAIGDYSTALKITLPMINFVEKHKNDWYKIFTYISLASIYRDIGVYPQALEYAYHSLSFEQLSQTNNYGNLTNAVVASIFYEMNNLDSAMAYIQKSKSSRKLLGVNGWALTTAGRVYTKANQIDSAYVYYHLAINELKRENNKKDLAGTYNSLASLFHETGNSDSAFIYVQNGIKIAQKDLLAKELYNSYLILSSIYEKKNSDSALFYLKSAFTVNEKLYGQEKVEQLVSYKFNEDLQKQEIKATEQQYKNKIRIYGLLVLAGVFLMLVAIMIIRNKQKGKLTRMLQKQKEEIQNQNKELNQTLTKLKSTQAQLIQQEKLASLGQLTAGIAHEIQNPLNFVNNFSEVNTELIEEANQEIDKGNTSELKEILKDIKENESKINHYGKRADAIVKGMLQHSRTSSGQKELTDINALCDEYLRLSYHGYRAKDKSLPAGLAGFNAKFETDFDESLPKVNVVPQDIGRVVLNLINNSFYAVTEKSKQQPNDYKPTVVVSTHYSLSSGEGRGEAIISVKDNGNGIPESIKEKIFQPFFTTKPTGQGTGLGLSLSYDIVRAHGGEIKVKSHEGKGSEFIIQLPEV